MQVNCKECGAVFEARQAELNRGNAKFCSLSCAAHCANRTRRRERHLVSLSCKHCGASYDVKPCRASSSRFCSKECNDLSKTVTGTSAARKKALLVLPNVCAYCGTTEDLILHHIDGNHFNNKQTNWRIVCRSCHVAVEHSEKMKANLGRTGRKKLTAIVA